MIKIIAVGKMKKYHQELKNYLKQIPHKVELIEVKDEPKQALIVKEEERILKHLGNCYFILLDQSGMELTSEEFSLKINNLINFNKTLTFVIGGSFGVTEKIKARADEIISFSKLTFPHQLFRVIFLEQLYRAFKIAAHHPYHK
ncbi:MAG: 23S rRNA (pseudouridine(1915)-N(3))-methyltransferase RlmH [Acholeplasmataceae bacterium]|jgi:23S rRNA (pseudouridine1915-N3)-methyltransferase|nr:23S rRNA (pseudouridine(1915)-N(3))-methyltransferase RlmH [Acholeplasmataceae bacterium]MCK9233569.1 23S rRNA (pseudouridine(1915)-N(3))-methyltransferase RlmH [Acholeplasmataceae bacterium]MCK9288787.1 23S rRNA (pseudouridine(1915)-N(3))-methyltransferase RlmH [Acholeplasmataceae bacterium]MCK9427307.1 23S rRNA (pseudouridine(1915)-N(3))-methyltransferase RlmH [Acholeplasmataceae bacterium]MDD4090488.1 23S rRNA (pseudouridine(1915)-N(3))-methyltransferase RlmH [Acholeplasmataceae bacterium